LIYAPDLSKHLTTSQCPYTDATNNGDCSLTLNVYFVMVQTSIRIMSGDHHHCL
jgi:hypothetical protein